jgi:hypothetical protein
MHHLLISAKEFDFSGLSVGKMFSAESRMMLVSLKK